MQEKTNADGQSGTAAASAERPSGWKRVLNFDLGLPGTIFETLLKAFFVIAMGSELLHGLFLQHTAPPSSQPSLSELSLEKGSPWEMDGGILKIGVNDPERPVAVALPYRTAREAYEVRFSLRLNGPESDLRLVFPVGEARSTVVMNLKGGTGLGLSVAANWESNPTVCHPDYHYGCWNEMRMLVRPEGERASIMGWLDGVKIVDWSGKQIDLTNDPDRRYVAYVQGWDELALATIAGGAAIKEMVLSPK